MLIILSSVYSAFQLDFFINPWDVLSLLKCSIELMFLISLCDLNPFKFTEICSLTYNLVHLSTCSLCNWKDCILLVMGRINVIWSGSLIVLFKSSGLLLISFTEFVSFSSKMVLVSHLGESCPHHATFSTLGRLCSLQRELKPSSPVMSRAPLLEGPFRGCFYQDLLIKGKLEDILSFL